MKITNENVSAVAAKGLKITRTRVAIEYVHGFGETRDKVHSLPVLRVKTYTVQTVRRYKDGRLRLAVTVDGEGYGCTLAFPMLAGIEELEVAA